MAVDKKAPRVDEVRDELFRVMEAGGLEKVGPRELLAWAKAHRGSALYRWLEIKGAFDARRAAEAFGLLLCQRLLQRVRYRVVAPDNTVRYVRATVSLAVDRREGEPSYRRTDVVVTKAELRRELLVTARAELRAVQRKYEELTELAPVWAALDATAG